MKTNILSTGKIVLSRRMIIDIVKMIMVALATMESIIFTVNGSLSIKFDVRDKGSNHISKILTSEKMILEKLVTRLLKQKLRLEIWINDLKFVDDIVGKSHIINKSTNSVTVQMSLILLPISKRKIMILSED